jgi:hypothetical protein
MKLTDEKEPELEIIMLLSCSRYRSMSLLLTSVFSSLYKIWASNSSPKLFPRFLARDNQKIFKASFIHKILDNDRLFKDTGNSSKFFAKDLPFAVFETQQI